MKGWQKIKIGDLGIVMTGNTPPRKNPELYGSHTPFIKPTDVSEDTRYTLNPEECYSELGYKKYIKSLIPKGATCVVTIGSIGKKITQAHSDCFLNQAMNAVIPSNSYDQNYVYYLLKHNLHSVKALDSGTASGRENVSKSSFSNIEIFVTHDLVKQRKIGKLLSHYDDLIENHLKHIKLLSENLQILYEEWFISNCINEKRIREKDFEHKPIAELIQFSMNGGWGQETTTGNFTQPAYVIRGTDIPDVSRGNFSDLPLRFHTKKNIEERALIEGDLIIEISNGNIKNVGRSFRFDESLNKILGEKFICASFCKMLRPKSLELSYLIAAHIQYIHRTDRMLVYKSQGANGINNFRSEDMISEELIPVPKQDILQLLVQKFEPQHKLISNLRNQIKLLKEARDILLPRLMTGMIKIETQELETA